MFRHIIETMQFKIILSKSTIDLHSYVLSGRMNGTPYYSPAIYLAEI